MSDKGIFVRMVPFPEHVRAVTIPNVDNTFDIYINSSLPEEWKEIALKHELNHIRMNHFYNDDSVSENEAEAG